MPSSSSRESNDANQESINTTIMADIDCDTVNKEEPVTIEDNSMEPISTEASFPDNTDELAASVVGSKSDNYEEPVSVEASMSDQTEESEETFDRLHRVNDLPGPKFLSERLFFRSLSTCKQVQFMVFGGKFRKYVNQLQQEVLLR